MGFFDAIDSFMDAVESGAVEKRVTHLLDKVEGTAGQAMDKTEQLADKSEKVVERISKLADKADQTIDGIQKKAA